MWDKYELPRASLEKRASAWIMCNKGQEGESTSRGRWLQAQARVLRNNNSYGLSPGSQGQIFKGSNPILAHRWA